MTFIRKCKSVHQNCELSLIVAPCCTALNASSGKEKNQAVLAAEQQCDIIVRLAKLIIRDWAYFDIFEIMKLMRGDIFRNNNFFT